MLNIILDKMSNLEAACWILHYGTLRLPNDDEMMMSRILLIFTLYDFVYLVVTVAGSTIMIYVFHGLFRLVVIIQNYCSLSQAKAYYHTALQFNPKDESAYLNSAITKVARLFTYIYNRLLAVEVICLLKRSFQGTRRGRWLSCPQDFLIHITVSINFNIVL